MMSFTRIIKGAETKTHREQTQQQTNQPNQFTATKPMT